MSLMHNVHETLSALPYFIDNEYLAKYAQLIERNTRTLQRNRQTHSHHIIPKSWYKLTNNCTDNHLTNLVNLPVREHVLAHYYLCLCTTDPFRYANELALMCLQTKKRLNPVDIQLLHGLPLYNNIYDDYMTKLKSNYKLYTEDQ